MSLSAWIFLLDRGLEGPNAIHQPSSECLVSRHQLELGLLQLISPVPLYLLLDFILNLLRCLQDLAALILVEWVPAVDLSLQVGVSWRVVDDSLDQVVRGCHFVCPERGCADQRGLVHVGLS